MTKLNTSYDITLDIGTTSTGWAVINHNYTLLKHKGKNLWGVRLFEAGETAVARRIYRSTRRRIDRRKERIVLLKELLAPMIIKIDPTFFMRLEKGYATRGDKGYDYNLFIEESFNDVTYYKEFKTIYHLRDHICKSSEKVDARLIYLALHHILKYRGHFLYEGQKFEINDSSIIETDLKMALKGLSDEQELNFDISSEFVKEILEVLENDKKKKGIKKDECINAFVTRDSDSKDMAREVINLLLGNNCNITKLFPKCNIPGEETDFKTNFSSSKYEEDIDYLESSLNDKIEIVDALHRVYSYLILQNVMNSENSISEAMIKKYEEHNKDLKELKTFVKGYYSDVIYNDIFRNKNLTGNYYAYVNVSKSTSKKELYIFLKNKLDNNEKAKQTRTYQSIMNKIEMENYLLKQNSTDNGAIPYQLHEDELVKILEKQSNFYNEILDNKDKIISIFKFRVPYYVGPLNEKSEFHWFTRKEAGTIKPWNFDEKIDRISSAEKFIRKMTNTCSYLRKEPVIAKKSLLYSRYEVLNELNKIRIDGRKIPIDTKKEILNEVFLLKIKVSAKDLKDFYVRKQYCNEFDNLKIEGFQKDEAFASSLESWITFKKIYETDFDSHFEEIEKIIEWITVYEDKKILEERIKREFPEIISSRLSRILKIKYKGWGRFSKRLLTELDGVDLNGNIVSIIDCLETTDMNFMQIINHKKLNFNKRIEEENVFEIKDNKITKEFIYNLAGSPAIKKGIWQTVKIVEELTHFMGHEPENIFIEFARSDEDKKRTLSRVDKLQQIYSKILKEDKGNTDIIEVRGLLSKEDKKAKLTDERLYLYYIQQGKCMYSGKPLDISQLSSYQIDHIIPRSYIKDDSIENKVLVYSAENQYKGDKMLLSSEVISKQYKWWAHLHKYKLIGDKKFKNLTRSTLSEMEEVGFINRQLVETRQITKHVANLFKTAYPETNIVSIKAGLSHDFRVKFDLFKVREINDFHHAQDAYLAGVIGTFVLKKYPSLRKEFVFTEYNQLSRFKKELSDMNTNRNKYGFILNQFTNKVLFDKETGEILWEGEETLKKIRSVFEYKDCYITKKIEEKRGQFFNQTIKKMDEIENKINKTPHKVVAINKSRFDITKYGGYTDFEYAYGIAVEYPTKKSVERVIVNVPRFLVDADKETLFNYLMAETGSEQLKIVKDKILFNQLIEVDGGFYYLASSIEWNNAKQLILSKQSQKTLFYLFNEDKIKPTDVEVINVYDEYVEKLKMHYPLFETIHGKFVAQRDEFIKSNKKSQILKAMLVITKANSSYVKLTKETLDISSSAGRINGKKTKLSNTIFHHQSITGIYSKKYKL